MYKSKEDFIDGLKKAHRLSADGDVYSRVGEGQGLTEEKYGVFRPEDEQPINHRRTQARKVAELARNYDDKYKNRFYIHVIINILQV